MLQLQDPLNFEEPASQITFISVESPHELVEYKLFEEPEDDPINFETTIKNKNDEEIDADNMQEAKRIKLNSQNESQQDISPTGTVTSNLPTTQGEYSNMPSYSGDILKPDSGELSNDDRISDQSTNFASTSVQPLVSSQTRNSNEALTDNHISNSDQRMEKSSNQREDFSEQDFAPFSDEFDFFGLNITIAAVAFRTGA